jgi:alcohol dehydrogenase class IV
MGLEHLPVELSEMGCRKPVFLFSRFATEQRLPKALHKAFANSGMVIGVVESLPNTPEMADVLALREMAGNNAWDAVLAVGSGAVADLAKLLCLSVLPDLAADGPFGRMTSGMERSMSLGVIPPSDASGWEASGVAVLGASTRRSPSLIPDLAVIDHRTIAAANRKEALHSGIAALVRSIERAVAPQSNRFVETLAGAAISAIVSGLSPFFKQNEEDTSADMNLASGIVWSGMTVGSDPPGITVRLSDLLSVPGGPGYANTMLLILPVVLEEFKGLRQQGFSTVLRSLSGLERVAATPDIQWRQAAIDDVRRLLGALYLASGGSFVRRLKDAGVDDSLIGRGMRRFEAEDVSPSTVHRMLLRIWSGEPFAGGFQEEG